MGLVSSIYFTFFSFSAKKAKILAFWFHWLFKWCSLTLLHPMAEDATRPSTNPQYLVTHLQLHWPHLSTRKYIWVSNLGILISWKWSPLQLQCIRCLIKIEISRSYVSNEAVIVYKDEILHWEKSQHSTPKSRSWANENFLVQKLLVWYLPRFFQEMSFLLSYSSSIPRQLVIIAPGIYRDYIVLKVLTSEMASLLKV